MKPYVLLLIKVLLRLLIVTRNIYLTIVNTPVAILLNTIFVGISQIKKCSKSMSNLSAYYTKHFYYWAKSDRSKRLRY